MVLLETLNYKVIVLIDDIRVLIKWQSEQGGHLYISPHEGAEFVLSRGWQQSMVISANSDVHYFMLLLHHLYGNEK